LTSLFIQFAEEHFTDYAADRLHHSTVKSCLVRIPGSLNSKRISKELQDAEVRIIQKWDGIRPSIQPLLRHFRRWLIDVEELKTREKASKVSHDSFSASRTTAIKSNQQNQVDRKWNTEKRSS
jgi:hypothetical protein